MNEERIQDMNESRIIEKINYKIIFWSKNPEISDPYLGDIIVDSIDDYIEEIKNKLTNDISISIEII